MIPWREWFAAWLRAGRPVTEFWASSPAQISFAFDALGLTKRRGGAQDLLGMLGMVNPNAAEVEGVVPKRARPDPPGRWK